MVDVFKVDNKIALFGPVGEVCDILEIKSEKDESWVIDDLNNLLTSTKEILSELKKENR